jgi:TPR repeat protein
VGLHYLRGQGVKKNYKSAMSWLMKSANKGGRRAMYHVGTLHENGLGVKQSRPEAVKWYKKSAKAGYKRAKSRLKKLGG